LFFDAIDEPFIIIDEPCERKKNTTSSNFECKIETNTKEKNEIIKNKKVEEIRKLKE